MLITLLILLLQNVPNSNPITLDSKGQARVFFATDGDYKIVLSAPGRSDHYGCNGTSTGEREWSTVRNFGNPNPDDQGSKPTTFTKMDGTPAAGYILCTYKAGTTIPKATYREPWHPIAMASQEKAKMNSHLDAQELEAIRNIIREELRSLFQISTAPLKIEPTHE